jgi:hypothetical protein
VAVVEDAWVHQHSGKGEQAVLRAALLLLLPSVGQQMCPVREWSPCVCKHRALYTLAPSGFHAAVKLRFPQRAVAEAGAPAAVWLEYVSPPDSPALYLDVTWVNKTATRLPEVRLPLALSRGGSAAADASSMARPATPGCACIAVARSFGSFRRTRVCCKDSELSIEIANIIVWTESCSTNCTATYLRRTGWPDVARQWDHLHAMLHVSYLPPLQALWVDWEPSNRQADPDSWRLWKLDSPIDPADVLFNGSRSLHAVGDRGFHVDSRDGHERLSIRCAI